MPSRRPEPDRGSASGQLQELLAPVVQAAGFDLEQLEVRATGRRHCVKVVVDSDHGVDLDDIAQLSRAASVELDQHEHLIGGSYTLEVTSPGVDRPLTVPRHWRRARLRLVTVRPREGKPFTGRVGAAEEDAVTMLVDGSLRRVPYADIDRAAVEVEFKPAPETEVALLSEDPQ